VNDRGRKSGISVFERATFSQWNTFNVGIGIGYQGMFGMRRDNRFIVHIPWEAFCDFASPSFRSYAVVINGSLDMEIHSYK
jgi:hypothetical protein